MNSEILQMISIISFCCFGVLAGLSIFLYIKLDIKGILDDLSGRSARRQIQELRRQNRGRTDPDYAAALPQETAAPAFDKESTVLLAREETQLLKAGEETEVLKEKKSRAPGYAMLIDELVIHTEERIL